MIRLECNNCGTIHEFQDNQLDYACVATDLYREMGQENEYEGLLTISCNNCGNPIAIEFRFWEYPPMALNYAEYKEEGGILLNEPDYQNYIINQEVNYNEE